jgi:hypothetical protein
LFFNIVKQLFLAQSLASYEPSPHFSPGGGMAVLGSCLHRIRASMHIIAQGFGFTRDFLKERKPVRIAD